MHLLEDLRYGVRTLLKNPGFTSVAVLALALGIGVNATVFTLANAVLFRNLPFDDSDKILYVQGRNEARNRPTGISLPDLRDFRGTVKAFSALAGGTGQSANVSDGNGLPERYSGYQMTSNGFSLIGQKPLLGRDFLPEDEKPGSTPVAILSHRMWQDRYGSDPAILGRSIRVNEVATTVIGVMPVGIRFPTDIDFWMPFVATVQAERRDSRFLLVFGRLADRSTLRAAQTEMTTVARRLATEYPQTSKDVSVRVNNFTDQFNGGNIGMIFSALLGAVGFVLLIACANVANMLLARAVGRTREISIRAALGASRGRLVRQLLTESLLIALVGGGLGILVARAALRGILAMDPDSIPRAAEVALSAPVLAFALGASAVTGLLFGLLPAFAASRPDLVEALKAGGRTTAHRGALGFRRVLVVAEVALAVVLVVGAGLLVRSFKHLLAVDPGFAPDRLLTFELALPKALYAKDADVVGFYGRLEERLRALPGVESVTLAAGLPPSRPIDANDIDFEGKTPTKDGPIWNVDYWQIAGGRHFETLKIPVREGRGLDERDGADAPLVVVEVAAQVQHAVRLEREVTRGKHALSRRIPLSEGEGRIGREEHQPVRGPLRPALDEERPLPEIEAPELAIDAPQLEAGGERQGPV
jgi:predicted permease